MKKHFTLWAVACSFFFNTAYGQSSYIRCSTQAAVAAADAADPGYKARRAQNEAAIANSLNNPNHRITAKANKFIPVVFHVVYKTANENVSDAMLLNQLNVLNKDFRRLNADTINDPLVFRNLGGDTGIEFGMATIDPNGNPTNGITRTQTNVNTFSVNQPSNVKQASTGGKAPWPNTDYLNIWVCNLGGGILGYAYPPGAPANIDGVVLWYATLPGGSAAPVNQGRTATHEVGHYLNLDHIWGDEPNCAADDNVADTPQQRGENYGCPSFPLTAGTGRACAAGSPGAMFMNYMDYVDDACMHMFTKGQGNRMLAALNNSRPTLQTSAQTRTLIANFEASSQNIPAGSSLSFTNTSTGSPTGFSWTFQGGTPGTSTAQNPTNIVYNAPGVYNVTLTITKGTLTNTRTISKYITVTNNPDCSDTLNYPLPGTHVLYTSAVAGVKNGFVSGTNGFSDKAKAEFFANTASKQIKGGLFDFGYAKALNANSTVTIAVWNAAGPAGAPGAIIASKPVTISSIITDIANNALTPVAFAAPVTVTGNYYMGVVLSSTVGDTVALITNSAGNSPAGRGWEQQSNNTWVAYSDTNTGWGLNISNAVFPLIKVEPPVVSFTPAVATNICIGNSVTFNSGATSGATSYLWSFPGGNPSTASSPNPTVTYSNPGTYSVSLTATGPSCGLTATLTKPNFITVGATPTVSVNPGTVSKCAPGPTTLTATGATTYTWSPATGLNTTTGATVIASPTVTTLYTVTGTTNGCSSTQTVAYVVTDPQANFTANPMIADLRTSGTVSFTNTSTNSLFYTWNFGDPGSGSANTSSAQNPTHTYTAIGNYTVTLTTSKSGCTSVKTATIIVTNTTGLQNAFEAGNIKIYPNPAQEYIQVEVPEKESVTEICLLNAIGQKIITQKPAAGQARLKVRSLPNGMYFVKISNAEGSITRKVTVMQ